MIQDKQKLSLQDIIGKGYADFWRFKGRYRVVKGSRASKKSKTAALNIITRMVEHPGANTMVVRKVFRTLKDSCFTELKWAIKRLNLEPYWHITESPLEMTYKPTKQKIYFRGMDDAQKLLHFVNIHLANTAQGNYDGEDVKIVFKRDIMMNTRDQMDTLYKGGLRISNETLLGQVPFIDDPQRELMRALPASFQFSVVSFQ